MGFAHRQRNHTQLKTIRDDLYKTSKMSESVQTPDKMKVTELRKALADRGLATKGTKAVLVKSLFAAMDEEEKKQSEENSKTEIEEDEGNAKSNEEDEAKMKEEDTNKKEKEAVKRKE